MLNIIYCPSVQWRRNVGELYSIVVKPRQPRFMIVQWNHRVEDKLLYRGVRLFAHRASKT